MTVERLGKVLAAAGLASRRGADAVIADGRVTVDGHVASLGERVDPDASLILVDGRPLPRAAARSHLAAHKPPGVTSTVRDRHADRTVLELVPPSLLPPGARVYPVGRLDRDSEGLLLLTDDGAWADRILHPRYEVDREYAVAVRRPLEPGQVAGLRAGMDFEEGRATLLHLRPQTAVETRGLAALIAPPPPPGLAWYRVTIRQGWKRQLRRMFGAVDAPVTRLVRVRVGIVRLDGLASGAVRALSAREVKGLVVATTVAGPPAGPPAGHPR